MPSGGSDAGTGTGGGDAQERARRDGLRRALGDVGAFGEAVLRMPLRPYQVDVARAVARSVAERQGLTFTVLMPRQAGKNQPSVARLRPRSDSSPRIRSSRESPSSVPSARPCIPRQL